MIYLGVFLALAGAVFFALGSQLHYRGVQRVSAAQAAADATAAGAGSAGGTGATGGAVRLRYLLRLLKTPVWLGGLLTLTLAILLHMTGVLLAPVSLVQPVGAFAVPISIYFTARRTGLAPTRGALGGSAATVLGVGAFAALVSLGEGASQLPQLPRLYGFMGVLAAAVAVSSVASRMLPPLARSLYWGALGGILFGFATSMMKYLFLLWNAGARLDNPHLWVTLVVIAAAYLVGMWAIQQGYATASPEGMVAAMTVLDPVIAVAFGFYVLREAHGVTYPVWGGLAVAGIVAIAGLVQVGLASARLEAAVKTQKDAP